MSMRKDDPNEYLKRADYALKRANLAVRPEAAAEWRLIARDCLEIAQALYESDGSERKDLEAVLSVATERPIAETDWERMRRELRDARRRNRSSIRD